jgi:hypothetical protein
MLNEGKVVEGTVAAHLPPRKQYLEGVKKSAACHPERCEGSPQFPETQ